MSSAGIAAAAGVVAAIVAAAEFWRRRPRRRERTSVAQFDVTINTARSNNFRLVVARNRRPEGPDLLELRIRLVPPNLVDKDEIDAQRFQTIKDLEEYLADKRGGDVNHIVRW